MLLLDVFCFRGLGDVCHTMAWFGVSPAELSPDKYLFQLRQQLELKCLKHVFQVATNSRCL